MNHFLVLMMCCLFLVGCLSEDDQKIIDQEIDGVRELKAQIETAYARYESGDLTASEVKDVVLIAKGRIDSAIERIKALQDKGVGAWEAALYGALSMILGRGWPSKGPLAIIGRLAGNMFTKRPKPPKIEPA